MGNCPTMMDATGRVERAMNSHGLTVVVDEAETQATEVQGPEEQLAHETSTGWWWAFCRSASRILSNYMYQQGVSGLYGDSGDIDDP